MSENKTKGKDMIAKDCVRDLGWAENAVNEILAEKTEEEQLRLDDAERYAETGLSLFDISEKLKIPITQELRNVVRTGRLAGIIAVSEALYHEAISGNAEAMVFYLQNVSNWRKKVEVLNVGGE